MTLLFGAVAALYDEVRPGYPPALRDAITVYHGGAPRSVVELGAGTGKGTELLLRLGAPLTAVEPDARMAAVLQAKFPGVRVDTVAFEQWLPPAGGVALIGCGLAWHWLDPATRNQRVHDALSPGGTLAVFAHKYRYADPEAARRIGETMTATGGTEDERPDHWIAEDVAAAAVWQDVTEQVFHTPADFSTERYLQLTQTFSPFRRRSPEHRKAYLDALRVTLDDLGSAITLDLETTLVLARRRA